MYKSCVLEQLSRRKNFQEKKFKELLTIKNKSAGCYCIYSLSFYLSPQKAFSVVVLWI